MSFRAQSRNLHLTLLTLFTLSTAAHSQAAKKTDNFTHADVEFMQDMMHHHAQAIEMCDLVPGRAGTAVKSMCNRIHITQQDEIEAMSNWLKSRNQEAPEVLGHHHGALEALEHAAMPGMMSPAQMNELARMSGDPFDKAFLDAMIRHHQGAVTMVKKLFDTSGAGQGSELFSIASGIDADQKAEIARMQGMLSKMSPKAP